jgi:seryl-tRNA synthetase
LQNERNTLAKTIGTARQRGEDITPILDKIHQLGEKMTVLENEFHALRDLK